MDVCISPKVTLYIFYGNLASLFGKSIKVHLRFLVVCFTLGKDDFEKATL